MGRGKEGFSWSLLRKRGHANTLISNFWPQKCERITFVGLSHQAYGDLLWWPEETNTESSVFPGVFPPRMGENIPRNPHQHFPPWFRDMESRLGMRAI